MGDVVNTLWPMKMANQLLLTVILSNIVALMMQTHCFSVFNGILYVLSETIACLHSNRHFVSRKLYMYMYYTKISLILSPCVMGH